MSTPTATRTRWQPLRVGLVDLFYYDYQEFPFRDGRILFRGNNGTGKSKVLALTLPLLLDGDLTPSRVEPDGDRAKKMEWNLLLGGRYDERLGYTFIEFGRRTESGETVHLTAGIGMKAVAGKGIADRWFFVTTQRVGTDLRLIGDSGTALTRDRLTAAIGEHGQVTRTADAYRRMLDEHLFHLGGDRYSSLVNMLIQLRQPQLSKKPDEAKLSLALSDALAPVDQAVLSDIAQAFHDLEQQRDELAALRGTRREVTGFVDRYRRYAAVAARRQTGVLRSAHHAYETLQRGLTDVGREIDTAGREESAVEAELAARELEQTELRAVREELSSDPRLKNLDDARRNARNAEIAAAGHRKAADRTKARLDGCATRLEQARREADATRREVDPAASTALAERAGVADEHRDVVAPLALPDGPYDDDTLRAAARAAHAAAERRAEAIRHLAEFHARVAREADELKALRERLNEAEKERDGADERLGEKRDLLAAAGEAHVGAWREYCSGLGLLRLPDPDETELALWTETLHGESPMRTALREAATATERTLATDLATAEAAVAAARRELDGHVAERDRLTAGEIARPPVPYTRQDGLRGGAGAALWQVVDFASALPAAERAGLEAALEASGLLDAWITPDGRLLDGHDTVLLSADPVSSNLAAALVPSLEPDCAVDAATVRRILECVGLDADDGPAWVTTDGRWRLGPLHGSWAKPAPAYIGHAAREEARRRRLAELAALIEELETRIADGLERVEAVEARQRDLAAELAREPQDQELRDAHGLVAGAVGELERAQTKVDGLVTDVAFKRDDLTQAQDERTETAALLRLPVEPDALPAVGEAVTGYRREIDALLAAARVHHGSLRALAERTGELAEAEEELGHAEDAARDAEARAAEERGRLETLEHAIGASVEELKTRLERAIRRLEELDGELKTLRGRHQEARDRRVRAEGRQQQLAEERERISAARDAAVAGLRRFSETGLLTLACAVDLPESWAPTNAVELARRAEELLRDVDGGDEAWRRVQDDIARRYSELTEALSRHGHQVIGGLEDWLLVSVQFQGRQRRPDELAALLDTEIEDRGRFLSERERELLENHLINDVAGHLQELISDAEAQVDWMNEELADRPTSTGMRLRLQWVPDRDGPEGLAEARRRLLRQNPDLWTPGDREAVGAFLQGLIEAERARDEHGTWQEHLRRALDYRAWHVFRIERFQDGAWRPGTGPASGGERVLTVSLPLFAAASSKYRSAHPDAPRLVALDEAFAGVDDDSRAKCLGLLTTFDLDVVMTSEREWGFYPTVPGLAAHHLVRRDGIDAVHVTSWEWDGHRPVQVGTSARAGDELF